MTDRNRRAPRHRPDATSTPPEARLPIAARSWSTQWRWIDCHGVTCADGRDRRRGGVPQVRRRADAICRRARRPLGCRRTAVDSLPEGAARTLQLDDTYSVKISMILVPIPVNDSSQPSEVVCCSAPTAACSAPPETELPSVKRRRTTQWRTGTDSATKDSVTLGLPRVKTLARGRRWVAFGGDERAAPCGPIQTFVQSG